MMNSIPSWLEHPDPQMYNSKNYVTLDYETTNIEHGSPLVEDNNIVLACWQDQSGTYHEWGNELEMGRLVTACNNADFLVAHNAKFELGWLARCGYDIGSRPVYCTMVGEWVLSGNRRWPLNLDACLERRGMEPKDDVVSKLIKAGVCPSDIPRSLLLKYGRQDVAQTRGLFLSQLREMEGTRLLPVVYTRCAVIAPLADIETNGLYLDNEEVTKEYDKTTRQYAEVLAELDEITGGINTRSPAQVAHFVYGKLGFSEKTDSRGTPIRNAANKQFPDGQPKTDEGTLLSLKAENETQTRFIELKKRIAQLSSALDKNLSMFMGACREKDCTIYGELIQGRTVTHRLASAGRRTHYKMFDAFKGCQFQNLPRQFKRLFRSRKPDWKFGEVDYTSLEFGVAGHVGKETLIAKEIRTGYDVHSYTREVISKAGKKAITRTDAKAHTFKPLYGGTSGTKAEKAYYQAFAEKYHNLVRTQTDWCHVVGKDKVLETEWGMRFYWPDAYWQDSKWGGASRLSVTTNVFNTPIQSFATADIVPIGLTYMWHRTRECKMFLVNTVHDSIEAEFPPDEEDLFVELATQSMLKDVYSYLLEVYNIEYSVDLGLGFTIGTNWGVLPDGEEEIIVKMQSPYYNTSTVEEQLT
jgi:DNA polymerase I-like protein with 3'-5' exonuclease and polymerase domains